MQIKQHKFAVPILFSSQLLLEIEGDFAKASSRPPREHIFLRQYKSWFGGAQERRHAAGSVVCFGLHVARIMSRSGY
jgi:hypothetical protein